MAFAPGQQLQHRNAEKQSGLHLEQVKAANKKRPSPVRQRSRSQQSLLLPARPGGKPRLDDRAIVTRALPKLLPFGGATQLSPGHTLRIAQEDLLFKVAIITNRNANHQLLCGGFRFRNGKHRKLQIFFPAGPPHTEPSSSRTVFCHAIDGPECGSRFSTSTPAKGAKSCFGTQLISTQF